MSGIIAIYGGVLNCYSTGNVSGDNYVGGVAGYFNVDKAILDCVALNPSVKASGTVGRIAGRNGTLSNNAAWNGIININGNTVWNNKGLDDIDGEDMTQASIHADGTLGGRFTASDGWTTKNGSLPGLFGKPVPMPEHLGGVGIEQLTMDNGQLTIYPNPTTGELRIIAGANNYSPEQIENVTVFDVMGRMVATVETRLIASLQPQISKPETPNPETFPRWRRQGVVLNISHLPNGVYFLRIQTENGVVVRKVVKD